MKTDGERKIIICFYPCASVLQSINFLFFLRVFYAAISVSILISMAEAVISKNEAERKTMSANLELRRSGMLIERECTSIVSSRGATC
ncbi:MAG: hypothetical protein E3K32_10025 [wastewater metagenome]|nr:hypothetical protein [Candidatus Loosdrechtia aerotolerans]